MIFFSHVEEHIFSFGFFFVALVGEIVEVMRQSVRAASLAGAVNGNYAIHSTRSLGRLTYFRCYSTGDKKVPPSPFSFFIAAHLRET